ncbi:MAG TPA: spore maturation protein [Candidatus Monoglobus merdigallinarum]|uniref:Spore maturation protein n=1 Tax=Candidatus Monoglobus merdigallinarum TaxID=2838698 RepID=A0A9D1PPM3_9FIRM|nr:spore maturation protein [Candidatus Monoglobus merdigallinarum]
MEAISIFSVPCFIFLFLIFGFIKRIDVYDSFVSGAGMGLKSAIKIIPSLIGLMTAIAMLRESGCLEMIIRAISPLTELIHMPADIVPLSLLRPLSGSASLALVTDIFQNFGPDSVEGRIASIMMGSTETTFYTIAVYFGSAGIKNIRYTLAAALTADLCGIIMSVVLVQVFGL